MTIHITKPEVKALINQRLGSGAFRDAEDVILKALQSLGPRYRVSNNSGEKRLSGSEHSERPIDSLGMSIRELYEQARP